MAHCDEGSEPDYCTISKNQIGLSVLYEKQQPKLTDSKGGTVFTINGVTTIADQDGAEYAWLIAHVSGCGGPGCCTIMHPKEGCCADATMSMCMIGTLFTTNVLYIIYFISSNKAPGLLFQMSFRWGLLK